MSHVLPDVQRFADVKSTTTGNGSAVSFLLDHDTLRPFEDRTSLFISVLPYAGEQKAKAKARDTEMFGDSVGWCIAVLQLTRKIVDGVALLDHGCRVRQCRPGPMLMMIWVNDARFRYNRLG
jgi:hypothetical protein